ncbi:MAG: hypothetical protein F4087_05955 [Gemmatimonadetes bacterium]|nr:hypothetical protein [Gemmatimonadota bacterium]MXX36301.1 hypothetical protein [Gemmatimonadota bacterium]MYD12751.1 hypothetical protein [Gemmatimonadota bacterium]MYI66853.1 hypothetical protein [Gemmatimonadota bacterium]MYJ68040.1 hypothetical protein [Gemmatimonadota bacterium]
MKNTPTRWTRKWTRGLVALMVAIGLSPWAPIGLAAQDPDDPLDNCWNNCGLEASLWMYEHGETEEEARKYFHDCLEECEEEEEGTSTC